MTWVPTAIVLLAKQNLCVPDLVVVAVVKTGNNEPSPKTAAWVDIQMLSHDELDGGIGEIAGVGSAARSLGVA